MKTKLRAQYKLLLIMMIQAVFVLVAGMAQAIEISPGTNLGGHFMFFNHDSAFGTRTYKTGSGSSLSAETKVTDGKNAGAYASWAIFYFNHKVNDWLSLEFAPQIQNTVGATPSFGNNIGKARTVSSTAFNLKQGETPTAKMVMNLPDSYEMTIGMFYQRFTWAYGDSISWQDHMMCPRQMYRAGQNVHDTGVQVYKEYDINGYTLPLTWAVGNGNSWNPDNDQTLSYLLKVEPSYAGVKFNAAVYVNPKIYPAGTDYRGTVGFQTTVGPWYARGEYIRTRAVTGRVVTSNSSAAFYRDTAAKNGYNILLEYKLLSNMKLMTQYYYDDSNGTTAYDPNYLETYKDFYAGFIYNLTDGADLIGTLELGSYKKSSPEAPATIVSSETLDFDRIELGTKITF